MAKKSSSLRKDYVERLKHYLDTGSIVESCEKFKIKSPAYRECISYVVGDLLNAYQCSDFLGNVSRTKDIYANRDLLYNLIFRYEHKIKANTKKLIGDMDEDELEQVMKKILDNYFKNK